MNVMSKLKILLATMVVGALVFLGLKIEITLPVADASPPPAVVDDCSRLRLQDFSNLGNGEAPTKVMSGTMIRDAKPTARERSQIWKHAGAQSMEVEVPETLPNHCLVSGYVSPQVKFELRLPDKGQWNGKFLHEACTGFCGTVATDATKSGLLRGYAMMTTDGGHFGDHLFDAMWANDNVKARMDFAYRADHVLLIAAKAIIGKYYGEGPKYSYITGCSKAGHAGVMSALRYPNDYDGVLARGPTMDYTGVNVFRCGANVEAVSDPQGNIKLGAARLPLIQRTVLNACDPQDGLADGLISDPRMCKFDPASMICKEGQDPAACLTPTEADALRKIYSPVVDGKGVELYSAVAKGSEGEWAYWLLPAGNDPKTPNWQAWAQYLKYIAFRDSPGPGFDPYSFDFYKDRAKLADMSAMIDATGTDLRAFERKGGKMIITHGWADAAVPAEASIKWYEDMAKFMGGVKRAQEFSRLFLLPGVQHCSGGTGPNRYDALTALENWVEKGQAPEMMMTRRQTDVGKEIGRTRPVYPYPMSTRYKGKGNIEDAANFGPAATKTRT